MPKYSYHCHDCGSLYEVWHGMTEEHTECIVCKETSVVRIPAILSETYVTKTEKTGDIVNETIEETKKEVEEYKKELRKDLDK